MDKKNTDSAEEQEPKKTSIQATQDDTYEDLDSSETKPESVEPSEAENDTNEKSEKDANQEDDGEGVSDVNQPSDDDITSELADKTIEDALRESESTSDVFQPDSDIDALVDDIVRTESDETIAETDAKLAAYTNEKDKKSFKDKFKAVVGTWWNNKPARYGTFAGLFVLLVVLLLLPTTRYTALNLFGIRVQTSMTVVDSQTRLPLKNINVALQDKSGQTDEDGKISFQGLKLGKSELAITKLGYADNIRDITLGWGSNPIGDQEIIATGEQFTFILRDWLNDEPITDAEASASENNAKADDSGKIILTVGQESIADVEITIIAEGYRQEVLGADTLFDGENELKLIPNRKHSFISNRDGQYDLYTIDLDASNETLLLEATGNEREAPTILSHPNRNTIAFVSSRDGEQNSDGFIIDGLFIVNTETGDSNRIARSEQLQIVGWYQDYIVYWQVVEGTSRANPERSKLISYNVQTRQRNELAAANYFNDVRMIDDVVTYAVSSFAVPQSQAKLYSGRVTDTTPTKILDKQVYSVFRSNYNTLLFNADDQKWYQQVNGKEVTEIDQPPQPTNRRFSDSPSRERTVWVEIRDGRGVLLMADIATPDKESQVLSLAGLDSVLYWANDHTLVFRLIRAGETADYVVNVDDPTEMKITDVTASARFYF